MSVSSYFKSWLDLVTLGELEGETWNLGKLLDWKDQDETWWEKIITSPRYVIDITGTDTLSLGDLGGGGVNSENPKNEVF